MSSPLGIFDNSPVNIKSELMRLFSFKYSYPHNLDKIPSILHPIYNRIKDKLPNSENNLWCDEFVNSLNKIFIDNQKNLNIEDMHFFFKIVQVLFRLIVEKRIIIIPNNENLLKDLREQLLNTIDNYFTAHERLYDIAQVGKKKSLGYVFLDTIRNAHYEISILEEILKRKNLKVVVHDPEPSLGGEKVKRNI